jgi:hypothetical protein
MDQRAIYVIGPTEADLHQCEMMAPAGEFSFERVLSFAETHGAASTLDVPRLIRHGCAILGDSPKPVAGIIAFNDFPNTTILPILAEHAGVSAPPLEAILACEHKYWSRTIQRSVIPEATPAFFRFDPFKDHPRTQIDLDFPFWVKPIKSYGSHLAFRVETQDDFERALTQMRARLHRFEIPFEAVLSYAQVPDNVRGGGFAIAEEEVTGSHQCTLEGYCFEGRTHILGLIDSDRVPHGSSFARYVYPSRLPTTVQSRMEEIARRFFREVPLQPCSWNIEFFWDETTDTLHLIEVNPRASRSHFDLYSRVDGSSSIEVYPKLAVEETPNWSRRAGRFSIAVRAFHRHFTDAIVRRVPSAEDLLQVANRFPDAQVEVKVREGQRLGDGSHEDSYSARLCEIVMGGNSEVTLLSDIETIEEMLRFELEDTGKELVGVAV